MVETLFVICTCAAGSDANLFEGDILIPVSCILRFEKDPFAHWLFVCWDCWSSYSLLQGNISISDNKMCFIVCVALIRFMITVWVLTQHLFYDAERKECPDWQKIQMEISNPLHSGWWFGWVCLILSTFWTPYWLLYLLSYVWPRFIPSLCLSCIRIPCMTQK